MRFSTAIGLAVLLAPVAAPAAHAQQNEVARKQAIEVAARVPFEKATKGAPYSADIVIESSQTLADGTHISRKTGGKVYRDGEGRVRREDEQTFTVMGANGPLS